MWKFTDVRIFCAHVEPGESLRPFVVQVVQGMLTTAAREHAHGQSESLALSLKIRFHPVPPRFLFDELAAGWTTNLPKVASTVDEFNVVRSQRADLPRR